MMKINNQKGFALYMILGFFVIASLGASALVRMGGTQSLQSHNYIRSKQAFYLAEAATERAKVDLDANYNTSPLANENANFTLGNGEYRYTVTIMTDTTQRRVLGLGAVPDFAIITIRFHGRKSTVAGCPTLLKASFTTSTSKPIKLSTSGFSIS